MKRILASAAIVAISATAFAAGEIDVRSSFIGGTDLKDTTNLTQRQNSGFALERARLNFSGKISDSVSGKVQINALGTTATAAAGSALTLINYAEVTSKFSDSLSITAGKLDDTGTSGFEGARSSGDMYFLSQSYWRNYPGGLKLTYSLNDHQSLWFMLLNESLNSMTATTVGTNPTVATNTAAQSTSEGYGVNYNGQYGNFGVDVSYHNLPSFVAGQTGTANTYTNLGLSYKMDAWLFSFDYDMNTYQKQGQTVSGVVADMDKNSMVLMVDYNMGNWVPQLKYETSTINKIAAAGTFGAAQDSAQPMYSATSSATVANQITVATYSLGTEYKPDPASKFRYHFMLNSKAINFATGFGTPANSTVTESRAYAGMRWQADFLK